MSKICPILGRGNGPLLDCSDSCIMYNQENGECIIRKALEIYIKTHIPITMKTSTAEELKKFIDMLEKTPAEPVLFKHPDLNIQHDYDEYGVDWYPHGYDDIAP